MNLRRGKSLYNSTKKGYLPPKKLCKVSQSTGKRWLLLSFWTLIDYNEKGVNFMAIYYLVLFEKLKNTIKQKRKKLEVCVFRKAMHPSIRVMLRWWSYKHLAILLNIQDLSVWYLFLKIRWGWLFLPSTHFFCRLHYATFWPPFIVPSDCKGNVIVINRQPVVFVEMEGIPLAAHDPCWVHLYIC